MATSIGVQINRKAVGDILKSPEVRDDLAKRAARVEEAAGADDFVAVSFDGKDRAQALVRTKTYEGRRKEATDRTLTRALDAGRD